MTVPGERLESRAASAYTTFGPAFLFLTGGDRYGRPQSRSYLLLAATAAGRCFCAAIHWFVLESNRSAQDASVEHLIVEAAHVETGPQLLLARSRSSRNLSWPSL